MDQNPPKRRFRFGLRSLLLLVALCGAGIWLYQQLPRPIDVDKTSLLLGASPQKVEELFGKPDVVKQNPGNTEWAYHGSNSTELSVVFLGEKCVKYGWSNTVEGIGGGGTSVSEDRLTPPQK